MFLLRFVLLDNQTSHVPQSVIHSFPADGPINGREERTTFLDHVVLDPGWEASHPPKDMVGFTMNETIEHMKQNPPPDRYVSVVQV